MVPDNWNKVTLEGYAAFMRSLKEEPETAEEKYNLMIKQVMYLTNCEPEEAESATVEDFSKIKRLIKTPKPELLHKEFELNSIRYRFKLLSGTRTGGELTAINNVQKRGVIDNLHQIMFLISEPLKRKRFGLGWEPYEFDNVEIPERINDFKQLTLEVANPAAVFFSRVRNELQDLLENYLLDEMDKQMKELKELEADLKEHMD